MKRIVCIFISICLLLGGITCTYADEQVSVSAPVFSGEGLNQYSGLQKGDIRTAVTADNNTGNSLEMYLICTLWERETKELVSISPKRGNLEKGEQAELYAIMNIPDDGLYSLKVMCWDKNLSPLCEPFTLEDFDSREYSFAPPVMLESFDSDETHSLYVWADTEHGCTAEISIEEEGFFNSALRMDYNRQNYGCHVQKVIREDFSVYTGLRFNIKGTGNSIVCARIADDKTTVQKELTLDGDWQTVDIAFSDFEVFNPANFENITFFVHSNGSEDRSGEGYFLIDNIFLTSPIRCAFVSSILTKQLGSCYNTDSITIYANLCSFGTDVGKRLKYSVYDYDGEEILSGEKEVSLEEDKIKEIPISFDLKKYGMFKIRAELNGSVAEKEFTHIPALDNAVAEDGYKQGYALHIGRLANERQLNDEIEMLKIQGVNIARIGLSWEAIEAQDDVWDWSTSDRMINSLYDEGIESSVLLSYSNKENSSIDMWEGKGLGVYEYYPPENLEEWGDYVYNVVSRYKDKVKKWEIWNEANIAYWEIDPDGTSEPDKYRLMAYYDLLKVSYLAAKSADPDCTVGMSGMSDIGDGFVNWLLGWGGDAYMDALVIHPYMEQSVEKPDWANRNFETKITHTRNKAPNLPIYLTEWGWNTDRDTTLDNSAIWHVKGIVYTRVTDVKVNTMYSFNMATDAGFGHILPYKDGEAKPQFAAIAGLNSALDDRGCTGAIETNGSPYFGRDTFACLFEGKDKDDVITLWLTDETQQRDVAIAAGKPVILYDMYGNPQQVNPVDGKITVHLDNEPVYLEGDFSHLSQYARMHFEQSTNPKRTPKKILQARTDYYFSTDRIIKKGETYTLNVRIVNYSGERTSGTVELSGIDEAWLSNERLDYDIENGKSAIVSVEITPDEEVAGRFFSLLVKDSKNNDFEDRTYSFKGSV